MSLKLRLASTFTALAVAFAAAPFEYFVGPEVDHASTHMESQATGRSCGDSEPGDPCPRDCHCLCCPSHANATPPPRVNVSVLTPFFEREALAFVRELVPDDPVHRIFHPPRHV